MFNWSLTLREQTGFISPVGPNFKWAPTECININGSRITVKLPRQKTYLPVESITLKDRKNVEQLEDIYQEHNGIKYRYTTAFMREWDFNGPWFTGKLGGITMIANFISPVDIPPGLNYFHPRALEAGVADFLTARYSNECSVDYTRQQWLAPMNWKQIPGFPCIAARFDAVDSIVESKGPDCYLVIPVAKTHLLFFRCSIRRAAVLTDKRPEPTIDEWIDHQPFLRLANQVLDSIYVELSDRAKAEQVEALQGLDDASLLKDYPPLKWTPPPAPPVDNSWMDKLDIS